MALYVVPRFEEFFGAMDIELPLITRATLALSTFASNYILWILVVTIVGIVLFRRWSRTEAGGVMLDRTKLRMPLLGGVLHRFALSEFCRSVAVLLSGGIPLVPAFEISVGAVSNAYVRAQAGADHSAGARG